MTSQHVLVRVVVAVGGMVATVVLVVVVAVAVVVVVMMVVPAGAVTSRFLHSTSLCLSVCLRHFA